MNRLSFLAREINDLRASLPELERDAYGVADMAAIERAAAARARLDAMLVLYFQESESERTERGAERRAERGRFQ